MALVDASEYAASPEAKKAYADAMVYQAQNPQYSSSRPSAASANGAYVETAYAPQAGVTTKSGANPNASTTESIFRDANGKATGLRRANGQLVYAGEIDPNELADFERRLGGGSTPAAAPVAQQAPPMTMPQASQPVGQNLTSQSSQTTGQNLGFNGTGTKLPGQYSGNFTPPSASVTPTSPAADPAAGAEKAQSYINEIAAAQKAAAIAALGRSRDTALSNLGAEKTAIAPKYTEARNTASAGAQQQARNFAEYMANRGGASSGAAAQAQISNNTALQGTMGNLGTQEAAAYTDIERRKSDLGNAYASDVASSDAAAEGQKIKLLYEEYVRAQQRGDTLAQNDIQNKMAQAQLELQKAQVRLQESGQAFDQSVQVAGLTGQYNGQDTLQREQLKQIQSNADRTFNSGEKQTTFNNNIQTDAIAYQKQMDAERKVAEAATAAEKQRQNNIALAQWGIQTFGYGEAKADAGVFFEQYAGVQPLAAQKLAADVAQMGFENAIKQALADSTISKTQADMIIDQAQVKIQQQQANTSATSAVNSAASSARSASNAEAAQKLAQAKFEYDKDPNNPDNILKLANAQKAAETSTTIPAKTSANNYNLIYGDIKNNADLKSQAEKLGITQKEVATRLLQANSAELTDADYRKLMDYINENIRG